VTDSVYLVLDMARKRISTNAVVEDCCCALSAEEHDNAIKTLQRFCKLTTSAEVVFE
jgi:Isochorismatase family